MPERDPFDLPEQRRTLYVYGAEGLLVLLLLHLRLNVPDLFPSSLGQYWTLVVMAVGAAYVPSTGDPLGYLVQERILGMPPGLAGAKMAHQASRQAFNKRGSW